MLSQPDGPRGIVAGSILVKLSSALPEPWRLEADSTGSGWAAIAGNPGRRRMERESSAAGWTFSYMAGSIRTTAFGFERQGMIDSALKRALAAVTLQKCNCLEIDGIASSSFLGVPYVRISAHALDIRQGIAICGQ